MRLLSGLAGANWRVDRFHLHILFTAVYMPVQGGVAHSSRKCLTDSHKRSSNYFRSEPCGRVKAAASAADLPGNAFPPKAKSNGSLMPRRWCLRHRELLSKDGFGEALKLARETYAVPGQNS